MNISDWKTLPADVIRTFRKYRIISEQEFGTKKVEGYTTANLRRARDGEGKILGDGPLVAPDALTRMLLACKYDGKIRNEWLDWMLFQCGGGQEAQRRATQAMEQVRDRFLDERVRGFRDTKGAYHAAITRDEAEAKWKSSNPRFGEVLQVGDQDMAERLQVFGFHRHWPGQNKIYEKATAAVSSFLALTEKTKEMNEWMRKNAMPEKVISPSHKEYATVDALDQGIKKIERFFASREARQDIRIETIFENDIVQAICPVTFAAAVRYGWDAWPFASRETFEGCLEGAQNWNDPWRKMVGTESKVPVYFNFRVPMPSWVGYSNNHFQRITLHNICALLPVPILRQLNPDGCEWMDEESRKVTITAICEKIREEVDRNCDPNEEEYPIQRGPRVYATAEEAEAVVTAFEAAWAAVEKWAVKFNPKQIVVDYMPK